MDIDFEALERLVVPLSDGQRKRIIRKDKRETRRKSRKRELNELISSQKYHTIRMTRGSWGASNGKRWNLCSLKQASYIKALYYQADDADRGHLDYTSLTRGEAGKLIGELRKIVEMRANSPHAKPKKNNKKPKTILRKKSTR